MFPPQQFTGHRPSSPGALRLAPARPQYTPLIRPTSSSSTAQGQLPNAHGYPTISLPTKSFQPAAERQRRDVVGIRDLPPLLDISYNKYNADYKSDNSSVLGQAEGKTPINLMPTEFSLKQFAKRMGHPIFGAINKWKNVWVAAFLEKKHCSYIQGENRLKQLRDGPLHRETVVADFLETFKTWLPLDNFDNAEWIR